MMVGGGGGVGSKTARSDGEQDEAPPPGCEEGRKTETRRGGCGQAAVGRGGEAGHARQGLRGGQPGLSRFVRDSGQSGAGARLGICAGPGALGRSARLARPGVAHPKR